MSLRTYNLVRKQFKEGLFRGKELGENISKQQDKLITWLIGFATGGIVLIISNLDKLPAAIKNSESVIFILLSATIIFGVLYRVIHLVLMQRAISIEAYLLGEFSDVDIPPTETDEDYLKNVTYDKLIERINVDFPDHSAIFFTNPTESQKQIELPKLKQFYRDLCIHSKAQLELAFDQIADTFNRLFKINKEKLLKKMKSGRVGYNIAPWIRIVWVLFCLSAGSFLATVILLNFKI